MKNYIVLVIIGILLMQNIGMALSSSQTEGKNIYARVAKVSFTFPSSNTVYFTTNIEIWNSGLVPANFTSFCGPLVYFHLNISLASGGNISMQVIETTESCIEDYSKLKPGITYDSISRSVEFNNVTSINESLPDGNYTFSLFNSWTDVDLYYSYGAVIQAHNASYDISYDAISSNWGEVPQSITTAGENIIVFLSAFSIITILVVLLKKRS